MTPAEILRAISELDERDTRILTIALDDGAHESRDCSLYAAVRLNVPLSECARAGLATVDAYEELVRA